MGFFSITTSGFLAAYALMLGCNNLQIGILAALPLLTQPLQIFAIPLIERLRWRKAVALAAWIPAQLMWLPIALIPFFMDVPSSGAIAVLLSTIAFRGIFAAVVSCAWNSWLRDLVPRQVMGSFFARRQMFANIAAIAFGLLASFFVDYWQGHTTGETEALGYAFALLFGMVFLGWASPVFMSLMPEPLMQSPSGPQPSLFSMLSAPFRDPNFRHLIKFLFFWGFALNLAIPFFAVYMLQRLGLPLISVIALSVLSQTVNVLFLRVWGRLADRFGIKAILSVSASLYLLVILGWVFTTMPERYFMTIPLLVILHFLAGIASAGVSFTTGTIGMKLAPEGQATPYLAVAAMATSLGSGLGPLLGGRFADFFSVRQLNLTFGWVDPTRTLEFPALSLSGFDFLFGIAFVIGILTLNSLVALREEGEAGEAGREMVLEELFAPGRQFSRPMSSVPGLNFLGQFPYGYLKRAPLPGLDVAVGVTAYQIADMTRKAVSTATSTQRATVRIAKAFEDSFRDAGKTAAYRFEAARHAVRGAMHAQGETTAGIERLSHTAVTGVVRALRNNRTGHLDALRGAGYGAVQGAHEAGTDPDEAARQAMQAARETARYTGLSEEAAEAYVARGALEAAEAINPETVASVRASIPERVLRAQIISESRRGLPRRRRR